MTQNEIKAICESGIEFKTNAKGKKAAYYFSYKASRKIRINLEIAEMLVATKKAEEVTLF
jgi:hypothetical protein